MIDLFMKRERHILVEAQKGKHQTNIREFGPQNIEDLMS